MRAALWSLLLMGCSAERAALPAARSDYAAVDADFWAAPFPDDARLRGGRVDMTRFPNPAGTPLVAEIMAVASAEPGFGTTSGMFFPLDGPIADPHVDWHESLAASSPIALVCVDPASPDFQKRVPVAARVLDDGGPWGVPNLLAVLPLQGVPLRPRTRYALVVRSSLLAPSAEVEDLVLGARPAGMSAEVFARHREALDALAGGPGAIAPSDVAALGVFTTGDPVSALGTVTAAMVAHVPKPNAPFVLHDSFQAFCAYHTTIDMPDYQAGTPPFDSEGGGWQFDAAGHPVLQRKATANFVVTIPRAAMPPKGYPLVVFSRTGGGGERPLVDRGVQAMTGGAAITPGTGPALYFAEAGFAGSSIDGPHGGLRNVTHGDEQFLMFNFKNPTALRDNVRQSAAEIALQAHVLDGVSIDVSGCSGATAPGSVATIDTGMLVVMGHSMGASIIPLSASIEPRFKAVLLSGAGSSFVENVIYKQHPLMVKGFAELLLGLSAGPYHLTEHDPLLSMLQWAGEPADAPPYADRILRHRPPGAPPPPHVLMMQGIVDHYQLPPIANATSLSFGLDLAGEALDDKTAEIAESPHLGDLLALVGDKAVALPATGNLTMGGAKITAVVTQHREDGVEDGHEVVFQTDGPKHEYVCFLKSLLAGTPRVPGPGKPGEACGP